MKHGKIAIVGAVIGAGSPYIFIPASKSARTEARGFRETLNGTVPPHRPARGLPSRLQQHLGSVRLWPAKGGRAMAEDKVVYVDC